MTRKRIGILTGGGDVQSLNSVIRSARDEAKDLGIECVGILKGWQGALEGNFVNLSDLTIDPFIGGTILKSSRINLSIVTNGPERVLDNLKKQQISSLIVVGGEDTLSNSFLIKSFPQILISKTIDNDVGKYESMEKEVLSKNIINYFTLGFPTASTKIAANVSLKEGLRTTAYSHERIIVLESMGMHTGWLALSSGMGSPDFIIIPEFPLDYEFFLERVRERYKKQRHLIIVISEGAKWKDGAYIYAEEDEIKSFKHPRFGGSANALRLRLKEDLRNDLLTRNINAVNPSYLYRSGSPNKLDNIWAEKLGKKAVRLLSEGIEESNFLAVQKEDSGFEIKAFPLTRFLSMEELHRSVNNSLYNPHELQMSEEGRKYFKEIIQELPYDDSYGIIS